MITRQMLIDAGVFAVQVRTFDKEYPDGMEITPENCLRAMHMGLRQMIEKQLSDLSLKLYRKSRANIYKEFTEANVQAEKLHENTINQLRETCLKAEALALCKAMSPS